MFFELTDLLSCPRCGPAHGLILLVEEVGDRRVRTGWLGCPHCRRDYRVSGGIADLRLDPNSRPEPKAPFEAEELALKVLALSGVAEERTHLLLGERLAHVAADIAEMAPELEIISFRCAPDPSPEKPGVSRILIDEGLPLVEYRLRAVAIAPGAGGVNVAAAARRVAAGGRLVLFDAGAGDLEEAEREGMEIIAAEARTAVAERRGGSLPVAKLKG